MTGSIVELTNTKGVLVQRGQIEPFWYSFVTERALRTGMEGKAILKLKELAGGDDGTRTRDLMRDRHAF